MSMDERTLRALGNDHYQGAALGWIFLLLYGVFNLGRGAVHVFHTDGGAASVAGIDLSQGGAVILALFSTMGIAQLLIGVVDLAVALRYRALAPLLLGYHMLHAMLVTISLWFWRPLPVDAPGKFGVVLILPLLTLAFSAALWRNYGAPRPTENRS